MATIMTKEGAKLHLVTKDGEPLCRPFVRTRAFDWEGYNTSKSMALAAWLKDDNHCKNCARMMELWGWTQFEKQIVAFLDSERLMDFPVEFVGVSKSQWTYSRFSIWPDTKIVKREAV